MQPNVDKQELAKFDQLAAQWWDTAGELKTLHQVNPLRLQFILEKVDLTGKKAIDIGCGGGILTESLAMKGALVTGIDMNQSLIEVAKLHQLESKAQGEYIHTTAELIAQERAGHYDVVTCMEMLEHVPDSISIVNACAKLAKPGGHVFFSTLNRNPKSYFFAILAAEHILKLLPKNTHDYAKFIRPSELSSWARKNELSVKDIRGIKYHPFNQTFTLSKDVSINYLLHAVNYA